ncbi:chemotaxis protein CheB [Rhodanobacter sp. B04]|uniref:chemotaxis protein CheB n=1 Tax=Rhodanobacter sp. B04 TaxID=1945860 RepID=UPI0020C26C03|nr:chemotaxis protein CheB [Rhodanobacter sp. B04]
MAAVPPTMEAEVLEQDVLPQLAAKPSEPDFLVHDDPDGQHEKMASAESENLAAELEALLASDELPADDEEAPGSGLRFTDDEELPPLHDGNFGQAPAAFDASMSHHDGAAIAATAHTGAPQVVVPSFDHLGLESPVDPSVVTIPASADEPMLVAPAPASVRAPDSWALLDEDTLPAAPAKNEAAEFGIEKLSAADFLAPDVEPVASGVEPVFSLELVSMEEAIAPKPYVHEHEMMLDELGSALSRIVLLGAAPSGVDSVCDFLAALPANARLTFLHTQHMADQQSDAALVERLSAHCALPVRLAAQGARAGAGEIMVVPAGQQVVLRRDGKIELQAISSDQPQGPSIDASFTMAANAFGRDAVAIVFAGRANDAVAGAQAIHDRGGQVWVESSSGEHFADMVSGIFAERLVSFSGTPHELAAHLIEVFP